MPTRTGAGRARQWPAARAEDRPFAWFAAAFALAIVAHHLWWRGVPVADLNGLVVVLAAWLLARPASPGRLAALAAGEIVALGPALPSIGDHTLLAAVTALAFLGALATAAVRERRIPAPHELWAHLAPFLRVQAVLLYAAAALAKLNTGFLDAATSCAGPVSAELAFFDPSLLAGRWHVGPAIVATVAAEIALAVLLTLRRTRLAGVVLGAGFHAALALAGNVPFAAYALALYVAFLPATALPAWRAPSRAAVIAVLASWLAASLADPAVVRELLQTGLRLLVAAGLVALAAGLVRGGHLRLPARAPVRRGALRPGYAVAAAVLAVNAASPYVGLKTEATFTMFSNLQTEPGRWNHVLVPEAFRVFGAQDELVRLESATSAALERRRRAGALMVRAELERYLRRHPGERATYVDAREPSRRFSASAATLPGRPVLDRILNFYDVRQDARGRC